MTTNFLSSEPLKCAFSRFIEPAIVARDAGDAVFSRYCFRSETRQLPRNWKKQVRQLIQPVNGAAFFVRRPYYAELFIVGDAPIADTGDDGKRYAFTFDPDEVLLKFDDMFRLPVYDRPIDYELVLPWYTIAYTGDYPRYIHLRQIIKGKYYQDVAKVVIEKDENGKFAYRFELVARREISALSYIQEFPEQHDGFSNRQSILLGIAESKRLRALVVFNSDGYTVLYQKKVGEKKWETFLKRNREEDVSTRIPIFEDPPVNRGADFGVIGKRMLGARLRRLKPE